MHFAWTILQGQKSIRVEKNSQPLCIIFHAFGSLQISHLIALATLPCRHQYTIEKHDSQTIYLLDKIYKRVHQIKGYRQPSLNLLLKKNPWSHWALNYKKKKKTLFSKSMSNNDTRGPTQFNSNRCLSLNEEDVECLRYFSNFPIHTSMLFSILTPSTFFFHHLAHWNQRWKNKWKKELWWTAPFY